MNWMTLFGSLVPTASKKGHKAQNQAAPPNAANPRKRLSQRVNRQHRFKADLELQSLEDAIDMAEDPHNPNRYDLYRIYEEVMRDAHLYSQVQTRILKVLSEDFKVKQGEQELEEATELLQRQWFYKFLRLALETRFWGHSLMEFGRLNQAGEFENLLLIWREHVKPETGELLINPGDVSGIPYRDTKEGKWLVEVGDTEDLGILRIAARYVILKNFSLTDWSRHSEKFGMPFTIIKSPADDEKERDELERAASSFGSNSYMVLREDEEASFLESSKSAPHDMYAKMLEQMDGYISKLISGQTGTSDEKSFVGSAEVHERIQNKYLEADLRWLQFVVNGKLLPFLRRHRYPIPEDASFEFPILNVSLEDLMEAQKKKPSPSELSLRARVGDVNNQLKTLYQPHEGCTTYLELSVAEDFDIGAAIEAAAERIFQRQDGERLLDEQLYKEQLNALWDGVQQGYGEDFRSANDIADIQMLKQLRVNVDTFAAFKTHHDVTELAAELTDSTGQIRTKSEFKKAIQGIKGKQTGRLDAEYNHAVASSEMASRWADFEKDGVKKLEYQTAGDERVRDTHAALNGTVKKRTDAFWDTYYPPNGWNCRCEAVATLRRETDEPSGNLPFQSGEMPEAHIKMFARNPAKEGTVFAKQHPYLEQLKLKEPQKFAKVKDFANEQLENAPPVRVFDFNNGGKVALNLAHDESELPENLKFGRRLAEERGDNIELLPRIEKEGRKNPDASINGRIADFKSVTTDSSNAIDTRLRKANDQESEIVFLSIDKSVSRKNIIDGVENRIRQTKIQKLLLTINEKEILEFSREKITNGTWRSGI